MSSVQEQMSNVSSTFDNDIVTISAASSLTFNMGSGTDTNTNRYFNLPLGRAYGVSMIPSVACSITKINGRVLKAPMSIGVLGWNEPKSNITSFTVQASSETIVEVEVKC